MKLNTNKMKTVMKKINKINGLDFLFKPEFKNDFIIVKSAEVEDIYSYQREDGSVWKSAAVTLWCKWHTQVKRAKLYLEVKKEADHITAAELYRVACNSVNTLMITENTSYNDAFKAIAHGIKDIIDCELTYVKAA